MIINRQDFVRIDYTPVAPVAVGTVVVAGSLVGYSAAAIAAGKLGTLIVQGIADVPKHGTDELTVGEPVYYDESAADFTVTPTGNILVGCAIEDVAAETEIARIYFNPPIAVPAEASPSGS